MTAPLKHLYQHHPSTKSDNNKNQSLIRKLKKVYPLKTQRTEIRKSNKKLLEHLISIITKTARSSSVGLREAYRKPLTLNGRIRKNDLIRITKENKAFLRRLEARRSCYNLRRVEIPEKIMPSTSRIIKRNRDSKLMKTMRNFEVSSPIINNDCIMMDKCNIFNKKLKKFGEDFYSIIASITSGKLKVIAHNIRLKKSFDVSYSIEQSKN